MDSHFRNPRAGLVVELPMIPWLDGLLKLVTYPADTLPGRLGRRIRRARIGLLRRAAGATAQITTIL
jgi:hypothetical protein